eukprot:gene3123-1425_t
MPLKVATDSIAIGCDAGVIKSFRNISKDTVADEPALLLIKQELEECECFLKVLENESLSAKREVFLQVINNLKFHLEAFGPAAFAFCLDEFHKVIKDAEEVEREVSLHCLMLKFLKTKQIVMDSLFKEYFEQKKQIRLVHSCLEMALHTLENEVNMVPKSQQVTLRFALLVDSNVTARLLDEFEEIENVFLQMTSSYIEPNAARDSIHKLMLDSISFKPNNIPVQISPVETISVINRYCKFLSVGKLDFSVNSEFEFWIDDNSSNLYGRTHLHLPAKSMLTKPVTAPCVALSLEHHDLTDVKILSRVATCWEACKLLHDASELDAAMVPTRMLRHQTRDSTTHDFPVKVSKRSWYKKPIPEILKDSFPRQGSKVYIYMIESAESVNSADDRYKKKLGFCTRKRLPKLPAFVIYKRRQKILLSIREVATRTLEEGSNNCLLYFHFYVLNSILKYEVNGCDDTCQPDNGLLWTVLKEDGEGISIDERFLESLLHSRDCSQTTNVDLDLCGNIKDAIVVPRHRKDEDVVYIVQGICRDVTPLDVFPNKQVANSYLDYYRNKHNIELKPDQHMVEVKSRGKDLNLLQKRFPEKESSKFLRNKNNIVIPQELCSVHPIPSHLWEQIDWIPVVIHRMTSLLLVKEFQDVLCDEFGLFSSECSPAIDDCICLKLNEFHVARDQAMLQSIEKEFVGSKTVLEENTKGNDDGTGEPSSSRRVRQQLKNDIGSLSSEPCNFSAGNNESLASDFVADIVKRRLLPPPSFLLVALTSIEAGDLFDCEKLAILGDLKELWKYLFEERFDYKSNLMVKAVVNCERINLLTEEDMLNYPSGNQGNAKDNEANKFLKSSGAMTSQKSSFEVDGKLADNSPLPTKETNRKERCQQSQRRDPSPTERPSTRSTGEVYVAIRNKAIADSVEALIGVCFLFSGEEVALDVMQWLGFDMHCVPRKAGKICNKDTDNNSFKDHQLLKSVIDVPCATYDVKVAKSDQSLSDLQNEDHSSSLQSLCDVGTNSETGGNVPCDIGINIPTTFPHINLVTNNVLESRMQDKGYTKNNVNYEDGPPMRFQARCTPVYVARQYEEFEKKIKYSFRNKNILAEALLHPSYFRELAPEVNCNQRLEFLGDSILYLLVTDYLCRMYPVSTTEELTVMRQVVISTRTFAIVSILFEFQKFMMVLSPKMSYQVIEWSEVVTRRKAEGTLWPKLSMFDAQNYHTVFSKSQTWPTNVPKDLADVFESVAAAIYIDSGEIQSVWRSYYILLKDVLDSLPSPRC